MNRPSRRLRICGLGNAGSVAVQICTRCFADYGHAVAILSPVPAASADIEVLAPAAGHATAVKRVISYIQMIRLLNRWKPDVIVVHFASLPFNWLLPLFWFKPLVVSLLGGDILFHQRSELSPRRRRATISVLGMADAIISRSDYMLAPYPQLQDKGIVMAWGMVLDRFVRVSPTRSQSMTRAALGLPEHAPIVLSPRRLVPVCGVASLVEAMPYVHERLPDAMLLAVDDQPDADYRSHVRRLVDRLGIGPRVRWIDAVDHASMPDLYRLGDVTVSVARSDGVSNAVLESMASRTPVVLGNIPNYEGIFADGEHCRMANPTDPRSIADAIVDVLTNTSQRTRIIETAYAKVTEYADFGRHTARLESQLRELVDSRSRAWRLGLRARHALNLPLLLLERDDAR